MICPINNLFMRRLGLIPRGFRNISIRPLVCNEDNLCNRRELYQEKSLAFG